MKHTDLIGLTSQQLLELAPTATHQHAKGGLYQDLGPIISAETKDILLDSQGNKLRAWLHVFPYQPQVFARSIDEDYKFVALSG